MILKSKHRSLSYLHKHCSVRFLLLIALSIELPGDVSRFGILGGYIQRGFVVQVAPLVLPKRLQRLLPVAEASLDEWRAAHGV